MLGLRLGAKYEFKYIYNVLFCCKTHTSFFIDKVINRTIIFITITISIIVIVIIIIIIITTIININNVISAPMSPLI